MQNYYIHEGTIYKKWDGEAQEGLRFFEGRICQPTTAQDAGLPENPVLWREYTFPDAPEAVRPFLTEAELLRIDRELPTPSPPNVGPRIMHLGYPEQVVVVHRGKTVRAYVRGWLVGAYIWETFGNQEEMLSLVSREIVAEVCEGAELGAVRRLLRLN